MKYFLITVLILISMITNLFSQPSSWKNVDEALNKGKQRTAENLTLDILQQAKKNNDCQQIIRSYVYLINIYDSYKEEPIIEGINFLKKENLNSPECQTFKNALLGYLYYVYYLRNKSKILDRTEKEFSENEDIRTWTVKQFAKTSISYFDKALEHIITLKKYPAQKFNQIFTLGTAPIELRPTVFDLAISWIAEFYQNYEFTLTHPKDIFIIDKSTYFLPAKDFINLKIQTSDTLSHLYQTLVIYQLWLKQHLNDKFTEALVDIDLNRIEYVYQNYKGENADSLYIRALKKIIQTYPHAQRTSIAYYKIAKYYFENANSTDTNKKNFLKLAYNYAQKALKYSQDDISKEAIGLSNYLLKKITEKNLSLKIEEPLSPESNFPVKINFRNTSKAYLRIYKTNDKIYYSSEGYNKIIPKILSCELIINQAINLPDPGDFYLHSTEKIFKGLKPGKYAIVISLSPDFNTDNNIIAFQHLNVSALNIITENIGKELLILITDRLTGKPLDNIDISVHYSFYGKPDKTLSLKTDKQGIATAKLFNYWSNIKISAKKNNSEITVKSSAAATSPPQFNINTHTVLFLDRKIYRPGQTVYFKGLIYNTDNRESFLAIANKEITLEVQDINYQTIRTIKLKTDKFGGFSGSFIIPPGRATGIWRINGNDTYLTSFRVEEYRRPQFEVKFDEIKEAILAGEKINIIGYALNYNGIPVENANVEYQVIKRIGWFWQWWWNQKPEETVMATGKVKTDKSGSFIITFPTDKNLEQSKLVEYIIKAKVTDINGETHSAQTSVRVANQSIFVSINAQDFQFLYDSLKFNIKINNINNIEQKTLKARYEIYSTVPSADHPLITRLWDKPDIQTYSPTQWKDLLPFYAYDNEDEPQNWKEKQLITQGEIFSGKTLNLNIKQPGIYKIIVITTDPLTGKDIKTSKIIYFVDIEQNKAVAPVRFYAIPLKKEYHPGENAQILVGTGWQKAYIFYQITWNDNIYKQEFVQIKGQKIIDFPITKKMTGGVAVNITIIHNNRAESKQIKLSVPYPEKNLNIEILNFKDKLAPGGQVSWQIKITDNKGQPVKASLVASAYDASLDAFVNNKWNFNLYHINNSFYDLTIHQINTSKTSITVDLFNRAKYFQPWTYPQFNWYDFSFYNYNYYRYETRIRFAPKSLAAERTKEAEPVLSASEAKSDNISEIEIRRDLRETAFFYPDITTDTNGMAILNFKLPESLTKWHLQIFANTPQVDYGIKQVEFQTVKPLMVYPTFPRFFRQGDTLWIAVKIYNNTEKQLITKTNLILKNASTHKKLNIIQSPVEQEITLPSGSAKTVRWQVVIPDNLNEPVEYTVTAQSGQYSDGQQDIIPVLNNKILVTETMPLPVGPQQEKTFTLTKLTQNKSNTLQNYRFVLEFNSNPVWYALTALPYTMEYPYECNEQLFSRMFANAVAGYILNSDPYIKRVFDIWKMQKSQALTSELEKKQSLKQIILEETPWLLDGKNETENRARLSMLFELNQMAYQQNKDIAKLLQRQNADGGWGWFSGMESNWFVTQHIILGFGRLKDKKVLDYSNNKQLSNALKSAVKFTDNEVVEYYNELKKYDKNLEHNHLSPIIIHYLYMRSFYKEIPLPKKEIFNYFYNQLQKYWTNQNLYNQATAALALYQWGNKKIAKEILASLRERSLEKQETGVYWAENNPGWFWFQAPTETQAMLIEAFNKIEHDTAFVEKMKIWLLKNKQTNHWESTKATVEAVYSLIFSGYNWLEENQPVKITIGKQTYPTSEDKTEAGTGYFQKIWTGNEITKNLGNITVKNPNKHPAWGAIYWQYFENMDKITPAKTNIDIQRTYYKIIKTNEGEKLQPITENTPIQVGDEILIRIILSTDREMEFVHLKDMRPAGFEPVEQLSGYHWQGGIGYYQSIRDASANFFTSNIQKGKYVFEYRVFATITGKFSTGIATFQCMYAPEFSAHSEGKRINIK